VKDKPVFSRAINTFHRVTSHYITGTWSHNVIECPF